MAHLTEVEVSALADGGLLREGDGAASHAALCPRCGEMVAEYKQQARALSRWADQSDGQVDHLWAGVAARLGEPVALPARLSAAQQAHRPAALALRAPGLARRTAVAAALLAASIAAVALSLIRRPTQASTSPGALLTAQAEEEESTPSARAAIERAEREYSHAAEVLEAEVPPAPGDPAAAGAHRAAALARVRHGLAFARGGAQDTRSRVRLLEGYSAYLKSLRRAIDEPGELE